MGTRVASLPRMSALKAVELVGLALALGLGAACGGNPVYSEACRDLSDALNAEIDRSAAAHAACARDDECVLAVVVVPCNRDTAHEVAIASEALDGFRAEIALAAQSCTATQIADCNAYCGSTGSLVVPAPEVRCLAGTCTLGSVDGLTPPTEGLSVPDAELCRPSQNVFLDL